MQLPKIVFTPRAEYKEDYEGWEEEEEQAGLTTIKFYFFQINIICVIYLS
jgi:hypothetical protein